ncbi:MAG: 2OG-Fe(II) oxygenase [Novosphingobium sp.]
MPDTDTVPQPRFFPHAVIEDFLEPALVRRLLDHVEANQDRFTPTTVRQTDGTRVDPESRISLGLEDLGECLGPVLQHLHAAEPMLRARIGMGAYKFNDIELQIAAHNDGGFFCRHGDSYKGWGIDRVISGVYYFHRQPCGFTGGTLRLYPLTGEGYEEVAPAHNSLVVFPSFVQHEVMPVACASGAFMDSRFAVNCWFRKEPKPRV